MGYFVGSVDLIGMRLIEIFEAIPTFISCSRSSRSSAATST